MVTLNIPLGGGMPRVGTRGNSACAHVHGRMPRSGDLMANPIVDLLGLIV